MQKIARTYPRHCKIAAHVRKNEALCDTSAQQAQQFTCFCENLNFQTQIRNNRGPEQLSSCRPPSCTPLAPANKMEATRHTQTIAAEAGCTQPAVAEPVADQTHKAEAAVADPAEATEAEDASPDEKAAEGDIARFGLSDLDLPRQSK